MLSIITTGRNDNYGNLFLDRFYTSVSKNLELLNNSQIEYEYLIIEWSSIKEYLLYNLKFNSLFNNNSKLKDIVITPSIPLAENLHPIIFYEFFAKNVGMRLAKYDTILILNSDIIIPNNTFNEIISLIKGGLKEKTFYRPRYRANVSLNDITKKLCVEDITLPPTDFSFKAGHYSGDLFFMNKEELIKYGQGYDETNSNHRTIQQTNMDTEIMYNMNFAGCKLELMEYEYIHIEHGRPRDYDRKPNYKGYTNKFDWGFIANRNIIKVGHNLIIISQ